MMGRSVLWMLCAGCQLVYPAPEPFDVTRCPDGYQDVPTIAGSRYRFIDAVNQSWLVAANVCDGDAPGLTHLFAPDTEQELLTVHAVEPAPFFWIGVARDRDAPPPIQFDSYRLVTGGVLDPEAWATGEPNNSLDLELAGVLRSDGFLNDEALTNGHEILCECDGVATVPFDFQAMP
jgi:hypothetical protein